MLPLLNYDCSFSLIFTSLSQIDNYIKCLSDITVINCDKLETVANMLQSDVNVLQYTS